MGVHARDLVGRFGCTRFLSGTLLRFLIYCPLMKSRIVGKGYPYYKGVTQEPSV